MQRARRTLRLAAHKSHIISSRQTNNSLDHLSQARAANASHPTNFAGPTCAPPPASRPSPWCEAAPLPSIGVLSARRLSVRSCQRLVALPPSCVVVEGCCEEVRSTGRAPRTRERVRERSRERMPMPPGLEPKYDGSCVGPPVAPPASRSLRVMTPTT